MSVVGGAVYAPLTGQKYSVPAFNQGGRIGLQTLLTVASYRWLRAAPSGQVGHHAAHYLFFGANRVPRSAAARWLGAGTIVGGNAVAGAVANMVFTGDYSPTTARNGALGQGALALGAWGYRALRLGAALCAQAR